jgi:4-aminobutyrate--pyruvate transaminase
LVGEANGVGLLAVVELVADKANRTPFDPIGKVGPYLLSRAEQHGLIVRALGDRIAFSPPLIIQPEQVEEMLARFARALDETREWVREEF